jgi:hypothetical protein
MNQALYAHMNNKRKMKKKIKKKKEKKKKKKILLSPIKQTMEGFRFKLEISCGIEQTSNCPKAELSNSLGSPKCIRGFFPSNS